MRRRARRSLTAYKYLMWKRYIHAAHLDTLDRALEQVSLYAATRGQMGIGRLGVEMPPRHGKSQTISRFFPAWHIGNYPDHRVILGSYAAALAKKHSRYARYQLYMPRYQALFPGVELNPGSRSTESWNVKDDEGGMDAMGVLGAVTGMGANILIWDDPVKNREEAESETMRDKVWDAWTDDFYTRLEPGGAVVGVMTRWQMDDWMGRLKAQERAKWTWLRLPAYAEANDPLGRAMGDPLWPERFSLPMLRDIEETLGPYSWSALYQQNPVPAEGGVFKRAWFSTVQRMFIPGLTQVVRAWDLAMSGKESADYTVGVKMGQGDDGRIYILDVKRIQAEWGDVVPYIAQVALEDGPDVQIGLEKAGFMTRAVQDLLSDGRLHGFGVWGYPADKDKRVHALPFAARCAAGNVSVVEDHWTTTYLDEMCSFDKGAHDDQVDGTSIGYEMLDSGLFEGGMNVAADYSIGTGDF